MVHRGFSSTVLSFVLALSVLAGLLGTRIAAQTRLEQPTSWSHFGVEDGLPSEHVHGIAQAGGMYWAATAQGLASFDGWRWNAVPELPAADVTALSIDGLGRVWVAFGPEVFREDDRGFVEVELLEDALPSDASRDERGEPPVVRSIVHPLDGGHLLSVRGPREWAHLSIDGRGDVTRIELPDEPSPRALKVLVQTENGRIWAALRTGLFIRIPDGSFRSFLSNHDLHKQIAVLREDHLGRGLAGFRVPVALGGLWVWGAEVEPHRLETEGESPVVVAAADDQGRMVVLYESGQLRFHERGSWRTIEPVPAAFAQAEFAEFRAGRLWVGGRRGLFLLRVEHPRWQVRRREGVNLRENRIHEIFVGDEGSIWTATHAGVRAWRADGTPIDVPPIESAGAIDFTGLAVDGRRHVWLSSGSAPGLFVLDDEGWRFRAHDDDGRAIGHVHKIRGGPDGRLWLAELSAPNDLYGASGGLLTLGPEGLHRYPRTAEIGGALRVYDVVVGDDGALWVGHLGGVTRIRGEEVKSWIPPRIDGRGDGPDSAVRNLESAPDGSVWFTGSALVGRITPSDDLEVVRRWESLVLRDLELDGDERLWVTSNDGLLCYFRGSWTSFGPETGLDALELWPLAATPDALWVGALGAGLHRLDLAESTAPSPRVKIDPPAVDANGTTLLRWTAQSHWATTPGTGIRTRWRLDDGEWSPWSRDRELLLPRAEAGAHSLAVEAMTPFGVRSAAPATQRLVVAPPLHAQPRIVVPIAALLFALIVLSWVSITRLRRSTAALRKSGEEQRRLIEGAHDPILVIHAREMTVIDGNARAEELFGAPAAELRGAPLDLLLEGFSRHMRSAPAPDGELVGELRARRRDGPTIEVEAGIRLVAPDRGLVILRDLSERRRLDAERRAFEVEMADAQKLESLGRLAGGVAHDFNNLLMIVGGSADQARRALPPDSRALPALARISTSVARANELTQQLLAFAGRGMLRPRPVDLNQLVHEIVMLASSSMPPGTELLTRTEDDLPPVSGDPTGLRQVLLNLILNAADALGSVGHTVEIVTRKATADDLAQAGGPTEADAPDSRSSPSTSTEPEESGIVLEVIDDGIGMDHRTLRRAFDPFFSTKNEGRGLGLAAVRGIVRSLQGTVRATSHPGQGARLTVLLPRCSDEVLSPATDAVEPGSDAYRGEGLVLIVDDEAGVRHVLSAMLSDLGFDVIEADGGLAAIAAHREHGDEIVLTLLDLSMPDLSGRETRKRIQELRADAPILLMSGFSDTADSASLGEVFLQKPFLQADVVRVLLGLDALRD